jgi:DNA-binding response OmpR family regulator
VDYCAIEVHMAQIASSLGVDVIGPARRGEILLIEDRNDVREGIAQLLELHGFMVTEVRDAEEGMRELLTQLHGVALVVLDLLLPGPLSGVEFRACQLSDPQLARIPTIIITASDVESAERTRLHPDGWLDKPFRFESLLDLVKRYVVPEAQGTC